MAVDVQGATIVREHRGIYYNVLVYKQRCEACGYLAPTTSFAMAMLRDDFYELEGFACPRCANHQAVWIRP